MTQNAGKAVAPVLEVGSSKGGTMSDSSKSDGPNPRKRDQESASHHSPPKTKRCAVKFTYGKAFRASRSDLAGQPASLQATPLRDQPPGAPSAGQLTPCCSQQPSASSSKQSGSTTGKDLTATNSQDPKALSGQQPISLTAQQPVQSSSQQPPATFGSNVSMSGTTSSRGSSLPITMQTQSLSLPESLRETGDAAEAARHQVLRKTPILTTVTSRITLSMPCGPPSSCVSTMEWWKAHTDVLEAKIGALLWALQETDRWKQELEYTQSLARSLGVAAVVPAAPWPPVKDEEEEEVQMQVRGMDAGD